MPQRRSDTVEGGVTPSRSDTEEELHGGGVTRRKSDTEEESHG